MAWNPDTYNKFKTERFAPFYDLLALLQVKPEMEVIDLGCGTGELSRKLADALPGSKLLGIDSSVEMLSDSKVFENDRVRFECLSIEQQLAKAKKFDLVFSNAAVQWIDNHHITLPKIISLLKPEGQLLVQIPDQQQNISNQILNELAREEPFEAILKGWKRATPVLGIDAYAQIFFENGSKSMTVFEKVYPLILEDSDALFSWVSGTSLIPYLEKLDDEHKSHFVLQLKNRLRKAFPGTPVFYPFKRIIMEAKF
jgi:trans-aconitate 2-methyltransferase